jgi:Tol biopolymer transport system component
MFKIIPLAGEDPVNVSFQTNIEGDPFPFEASPDLTQIAFTVNTDNRKKDIYVIPFSLSEGRTTGPEQLVFEGWSGGAYNVNIAWSPDGKNLAVIHDGDIWVCPTTKYEPLKITDTPETERWVNWSPDGRMIAYLVYSSRTAAWYTISPKGGDAKMIALEDLKTGTWSPDSKVMAILAKNEIQIATIEGNVLNQIATLHDLGLDDTSAPRYSPDGKHLAFIGYFEGHDKTLICVHSLESGETIKIADKNVDDNKYALRWSPDGKWLSYLTEENIKVRPEGSLWETDFDEVIERLTSD